MESETRNWIEFGMDLAHSRVGRAFVCVAAIAGVYLFYRAGHPDDYELLRKPLTVRQVRQTVDEAKLFANMENGLEGDSPMILTEVVLSANNTTGRQYKVTDFPDDGYFPADADGLVDKVSRRDVYPLGSFGKPKYGRRKSWKVVPFDLRLYEILTDKFTHVAKQDIEGGMIVE